MAQQIAAIREAKRILRAAGVDFLEPICSFPLIMTSYLHSPPATTAA